MDEHQYWIAFWKIVAVAATTCVVSISGCVAHKNAMVRDMAKSGVTPALLACALHGREDRPRNSIIINGVRQ